MRKFLTLLFISFASVAFAQLNDGDISKYLKGAVPVVDGNVVFSEKIDIVQGYTAEQIKSIGKVWMEKFLSGYDVNRNRIISDKDGAVTAVCDMEIIFKKTGLILDRGVINFVMILNCTANEAELSISRIKYKYAFVEKIETFTAEEYITDKDAVNKHNTKLLPITGKIRKATVDMVYNIFDEFKNAYSMYSKDVIAKAVINAPKVMTAVEPAQPVQPVPQTQPVQPVAVTGAQTMQGYKSIDPKSIPGNFIKMVSEDWMLVTAGNKEKFNMMTASWGGIGVLYNKPVAICYINPARYTYQIIENSDTFTLSFYTEVYRDALNYCGSKSGRDEDKVKGSGLTPIELEGGAMAFGEAWMIIECKKLVSQSISLDAIDNEQERAKRATTPMHKMYIGEIVNVWVK